MVLNTRDKAILGDSLRLGDADSVGLLGFDLRNCLGSTVHARSEASHAYSKHSLTSNSCTSRMGEWLRRFLPLAHGARQYVVSPTRWFGRPCLLLFTLHELVATTARETSFNSLSHHTRHARTRCRPLCARFDTSNKIGRFCRRATQYPSRKPLNTPALGGLRRVR